eukprot:2585375-Lingulodinium_polyedra.AAC.1
MAARPAVPCWGDERAVEPVKRALQHGELTFGIMRGHVRVVEQHGHRLRLEGGSPGCQGQREAGVAG